MKIVRDYLTSEELIYIIDSMLKLDSAVGREVIKVGLVAQFVCEDIGEFEDCNGIYDKVVSDPTLNFSAIINNYDTIDKMIAQETSVEKILKDFVDSINKKLESMKDIDLNSVIAQLKELAQKGDVVNNGKHKVQQSPRNKKVSK